MTWSVGRMSSLQFNMFNRDTVSRSTLDLQKAAQEVASGKRSNIFADLGPNAATALKLRAREDETQTYMVTNDLTDSKLQTMAEAVSVVRDQLGIVMEAAMANAIRPDLGAEAIQMTARAAIETVMSALNTNFNGENLFSGTKSGSPALIQWNEANATTGLSPEDVLSAIIGAGPTDAASATSIAAEIAASFNNTSTTNPSFNFEATFYLGTPELDGTGLPSERVNGRIGPGQQLEYGVQANDLGMRDALRGLAMLASIDVSKITDEETYVAWMTESIDALNKGQSGTLSIATTIGFSQQVLETAQSRLDAISIVQRTQIGNYENVDPYEAVTRMTNLENQLQASYHVAARMSGLTILNYL